MTLPARILGLIILSVALPFLIIGLRLVFGPKGARLIVSAMGDVARVVA